MSMTTQNLHATIAKNPNIQWDHYHALIQSQSKIRWEQVKLGHLTHEWSSQQDNYEHDYPNPVSQKEHWLRYLTTDILKVANIRWAARNTKIYPKGMYNQTKDKILHHICTLYSAKNTMSPQDHHTFHPDLEDWPSQSITLMKYWIT
eukprot:10188816-Ditylum_brightwellii.AAC.1